MGQPGAPGIKVWW